MRRPVWFRLLAATSALCIGAALAEPAALHSCPMHGSQAGHQTAAASHAGHHNGAPSDDTKHHCTCVGACCCAPRVAGPAPAVAALVTRIVVVAVAVHAPRNDAAVVVAAPHSHPFATAPPTTSSL